MTKHKNASQLIKPGSIHEARLTNTRNLAATLAPGQKGQAALAKELNRSASQICHMIGANPTKRIGEIMAREIEKAFRKPPYWIDQFHDGEYSDPVPPNEYKETSEEIGCVNERLWTLRYKWADLARELDTNDQTVYNWRARDGGIPKAYLAATARFLECTIDWLLTGSDGTVQSQSANKPGSPTEQENTPNSTTALLIEQLNEAHRRIGCLELELKQIRNPDCDAERER